ncbi:hypothetical protein IV04_15445 [Serratia sp. Ag1]|nr:hypothetical protein JV45_03075 [Serratia sp. Ag2]KFK97263.1 hypothetical protein IV04_15445 [Serratia sp. Ag1]
MQHTEQACLVETNPKLFRLQWLRQEANFLSLENIFYNEWKYNAAFIYNLWVFNRNHTDGG